jgi:hypothetical protein
MARILPSLLLCLGVGVAASTEVVSPPGGFTSYSWDTLSTFCFPGGTGDVGWGPHNQSAFTSAQIALYTKFDFIMIAMLNQTARQEPCPGNMQCDFVPQGTAMSVKQAEAIKAMKPSAIVFAYITGFLAQSTFEGGAKLAAKDPSWWLSDSKGVPLNNNYTTKQSTSCKCSGYTQQAPGPMWDFRQQRVRDFFMDEMVAPMVFDSKDAIDGIFFDDALDIPNYCLVPPHGSPPCTGNFTWKPSDQADIGTATLAHWDNVLGEMAAENKGVVMSMNPVTSSSYPINSSAGDGMLQKHRSFHFFEFFCHIGAPADISEAISLGLNLGARGVPFLAHAGGGAAVLRSSFKDREYCLAAYLMIASEWSFYGVSSSWTADSFPWFQEFEKPLGKPIRVAKPGLKHGQWLRQFEHVGVAIDTKALTASVTWKSL